MPPEYGFQNHRLNEIKSAPAYVKVTIDEESVNLIINQLELLEQRMDKLENRLATIYTTVLNIQNYDGKHDV